MLRPKKRITKRQLKEDALVSTYVKVTTFYEKHKRQISIGITAIVVVAIVALIYFRNRADSNERAMAQMAAVYAFFDNGQYQIAVDGAPERNIAGLRSIVDNYGGSDGESSPGSIWPTLITIWTARSWRLAVSRISRRGTSSLRILATRVSLRVTRRWETTWPRPSISRELHRLTPKG